MTNMKKMTKRDYFNALLALEAVKADSALVDFINHELELLAKKNASEKKLTPTQKENLTIQEAILSHMEPNVLYTITDFIKTIPECAEMSNQRVSAIVRIMREEKKVERIEEKRKAYFRLPQSIEKKKKKKSRGIAKFPLTNPLDCAIL